MPEARSEWVVRRPAPSLATFVERYVGYSMTGHPPGLHRGLPSRHLTFMVSIGPRIDVVAQTDPSQAPARYRTVVSGLQATSARIAHDGHQEGIAVELTPLGARALLGVPARGLWNTSAELADVVGPRGDELWERVQEAVGWPARMSACDDVLTGLLTERVVAPELARAWGALVGSGGAMPIGELAGHLGWSRHHLTRRFQEEFGLTPKLAARVVRFERALQVVRGGSSSVSLAQVAASFGYYDQAHLSRDFTELAGVSPGRLRAEEDLPSFQDAEAGAPR